MQLHIQMKEGFFMLPIGLVLALFVSSILSQILSKIICEKARKTQKFLTDLYKFLSYCTLLLIAILAILSATQIVNNFTIGIIAFVMSVLLFTSLNIEHYLKA